jgi:hypothetical protein
MVKTGKGFRKILAALLCALMLTGAAPAVMPVQAMTVTTSSKMSKATAAKCLVVLLGYESVTLDILNGVKNIATKPSELAGVLKLGKVDLSGSESFVKMKDKVTKKIAKLEKSTLRGVSKDMRTALLYNVQLGKRIVTVLENMSKPISITTFPGIATSSFKAISKLWIKVQKADLKAIAPYGLSLKLTNDDEDDET